MGKNTIIKDAIALFVITLVAGLCLGFVYDITKSPIEQANIKAKNEAYQKVFKDASTFEENAEITSAVSSFEADGAVVTEVLVAKDSSGAELGYVISVTAKEGYGGDIGLSLGVDLEGTMTGLEVLSMSETAGLGAKCTSDEFKGQFAGVKAEQIVLNQDIDQISGSTITSNAVTKAVNAALRFVHENAGN